MSKELAAIPDSTSALAKLSVMLIKEQKWDESIPYLNKVLSANPNDFTANYHLGQVYRMKKDCARARAFLKAAASVAVAPDDKKDASQAMKQLVKDCGNSE